jgi:hydrogenase maturation protease
MTVLVLGIGNLLLQDEGIGVRIVQELQRRYQLPAEVEVLDGGTAGMELIEALIDKTWVIVIDAVRTGQPPGTPVRLAGPAVPVFFQQRITPHQLGIADVLASLTVAGKVPPHLVLIGIVPHATELSLTLSAGVACQVETLLAMVLAELAGLGIHLPAKTAVPGPSPHRLPGQGCDLLNE